MRGKNTVDWCYMMADIFRNDLIKQLDNFNPGWSKQKFTCLGFIIIIFRPINAGVTCQLVLESPQINWIEIRRPLFILGSAAWEIKQKTCIIYYWASRWFSFVLFPQALESRMNLIYRKWSIGLRNCFSCICLEPRTMSRDVYLRVTAQKLFPKSLWDCFPLQKTISRMGTSFRRNDYWVRLSWQALNMIG